MVLELELELELGLTLVLGLELEPGLLLEELDALLLDVVGTT